MTYLRAEAEKLGVSVADLVRRIVDFHRGKTSEAHDAAFATFYRNVMRICQNDGA